MGKAEERAADARRGKKPRVLGTKPEAATAVVRKRKKLDAAVPHSNVQPATATKRRKPDTTAINLEKAADGRKRTKLGVQSYYAELLKLQVELAKLQEWIKLKGLRVVTIFEGRDAAGKGGTIKVITQNLNPRVVRIVALGVPTERERSQWYFQRYAEQLPAAGEWVLFDRSWYNRPGVERVMGFCTEDEVADFFRACPHFEEMLLNAGIILIKYWFSVSDEEQDRRFRQRVEDPLKRWKFSEMDLQGRDLWVEYSKAKDDMFRYTDTKRSPWYVVEADDKRRARLNCIHHLLSLIPYQNTEQPAFELPPRKPATGYVRPPIETQTFIPDVYREIGTRHSPSAG